MLGQVQVEQKYNFHGDSKVTTKYVLKGFCWEVIIVTTCMVWLAV